MKIEHIRNEKSASKNGERKTQKKHNNKNNVLFHIDFLTEFYIFLSFIS